jgi:hypothetical protein
MNLTAPSQPQIPNPPISTANINQLQEVVDNILEAYKKIESESCDNRQRLDMLQGQHASLQ